MKKFLLIMILSLMCTTFFFSTVNVRASSYKYSVDQDVTYIYEILTWNGDAAKDVFDMDKAENVLGDGAQVGAMQCRAITNIESHSKGWYLEGYRWTGKWETLGDPPKRVWVKDKSEFQDIDNDEVELYEEDDLIIYKDPEEWGEDIGLNEVFNIILKLTMGVPTPVEDYLKGIDWNINDLSISDLHLRFKLDKEDSGFDETVWIEYSWDVKGVYQGQKWTKDNKEKTVIFEIGTQKTIPGYEVPILLGAFSAMTLGIIIYIVKKKKGLTITNK